MISLRLLCILSLDFFIISICTKFRSDNDNTGRSSNYGLILNPSLAWTFKTNGSIFASPSFDSNGNIFIGSTDQYIYSLTSVGNLRWKFKTNGPIISSAVVTSTYVYVGSTDFNLYSIDINTGILQWQFNTTNEVISSPTLSPDQNIIYIPSKDGLFYAINATKGTKIYSIKTYGPIISSPAIASSYIINTKYSKSHYIYFGSTDGFLHAINTTEAINTTTSTTTISGSILWKLNVNANNTGTAKGIYSSPALNYDENVIYIVSYVAYTDSSTLAPFIFALSTIDGSLLWSSILLVPSDSFTTNSNNYIVTSPAVSSDGNVFIITDSLNVFTFNSNGEFLQFIQPRNTYSGNYGGSVVLGNDASVYILTSVLNELTFTPSTGFAIVWSSSIYNNINNNKLYNYYLNPTPGINIMNILNKGLQKCVVFGSYDGTIYTFIQSTSNSGGGGHSPDFGLYNLADLIFVLPLFIAGICSLCWLIRFRMAFYLRMRHLRRERELRRLRGEEVDDVDRHIEELLATLNEDHVSTPNEILRRRQIREQLANTLNEDNRTNYLKNNWKQCCTLPVGKENVCSICFADLFEANGKPTTTNTTNSNSNNNNITAATRTSFINIFRIHTPTTTSGTPSTNAHTAITDDNNNAATTNKINNTANINSTNESTLTQITPPSTTTTNMIEQEIVVKLPCEHIFHESCIKAWTENHSSCPICRFRPCSYEDTPADHQANMLIGMDSAFIDEDQQNNNNNGMNNNNNNNRNNSRNFNSNNTADIEMQAVGRTSNSQLQSTSGSYRRLASTSIDNNTNTNNTTTQPPRTLETLFPSEYSNRSLESIYLPTTNSYRNSLAPTTTSTTTTTNNNNNNTNRSLESLFPAERSNRSLESLYLPRT